MPAFFRRLPMLLLLLALAPLTAMGTQADGDEATNGADEDAERAPEVLDLKDRTPVVWPGGLFVVTVAPSVLDPSDLTVTAQLLPPLDPSADGQAPDDQDDQTGDSAGLGESELGDTANVVAADVLVAADGDVTIRMPVSAAAGDGALVVDEPGLYPVRIGLTDGDGLRAEVETLMLVPPPADAGPRPTLALLLEVGEGGHDPETAAVLLAEHPDLNLMVALQRDAVLALRNDPDLAESFRSALGPRPVVVGTSVPLDASALAAVGRSDIYREAHLDMQRMVGELTLPVDTASTIIEAPLTAEGVGLLSELGVTTTVTVGTTQGPSRERWPTVTGMTATGAATPLLAVGTDAGRATTQVAAGSDPTRQAETLLALLVLAPSPVGAPVALGATARLDDPSAALHMLEAAAEAEALELVSITDPRFRTLVPAAGAVALQAQPEDDLSGASEALARVDSAMTRHEQFHAGGSRSPSHFRAVLTEALRNDVSDTTRLATLERIESEIARDFSSISLPGNQPVTLAARTAPLPVAVLNESDGPRNVLVRLTSDKISLTEPDLVVAVPPGGGVVELPVRAGSLGASPVVVTLLSPDGSTVLATTRFQVRSTAVPGLGLLLSALGVGALALWWWFSARKTRRTSPPDHDDGPEGEKPGPDAPTDGRAGLQLPAVAVEPRTASDPAPVAAAGTGLR